MICLLLISESESLKWCYEQEFCKHSCDYLIAGRTSQLFLLLPLSLTTSRHKQFFSAFPKSSLHSLLPNFMPGENLCSWNVHPLNKMACKPKKMAFTNPWCTLMSPICWPSRLCFRWINRILKEGLCWRLELVEDVPVNISRVLKEFWINHWLIECLYVMLLLTAIPWLAIAYLKWIDCPQTRV